MIYQKIFTDEKPYHIRKGQFYEFPEHRHADFEMNFCIEGSFDIVMDKKTYHVEAGQTTFIPSMCAHAVPSQDSERNVVTVIAGMAFLKKHFTVFSRFASEPMVYDLNTPELQKVKELFLECVEVLH